MINTIKIQEREPDDIKEKEKDNKDETKNIREGLTEEGGVGFLFGILILTIPLAIYFLKNVLIISPCGSELAAVKINVLFSNLFIALNKFLITIFDVPGSNVTG